jgi:hypothetical protein
MARSLRIRSANLWWPIGDGLESSPAKGTSAKLAQAEGGIKFARLDASPKLVDKLQNPECEDDVLLLAQLDRHC